ncbi:toprim domain-containing protein [Persicitalea jodogahamensis]|uniref:Toprim domain-containing protein n=1 Tax=Persicitalea jodogahamensis TaxID=402147 RepID=A0A8J3DE57_9BACT|nr:toprim domain-containing protein [Persicitalea jodogahamensis]GHB87895.1 hypothetical protein GCM10007390_50030 [Persicitalea jodogahamensis]
MTKFDELKERFPNLIPVQELRANVSIIELAVQYGYKPLLRKGRNRPVLEHSDFGDIIIIKNPQDASQQVYQRAGDFTDSGTIIDFIRNRLSTVFSIYDRPGNHEFKNITNVLYDYLRVDPARVSQNQQLTPKLAESSVKQPFAKEKFDVRPLEEDNYLITRHIAPEILLRPEFVNKVVTHIAHFNPESSRTEDFLTVKEHPERNYHQFSNVAFPYYNGQSTEVTGLELRNDNLKVHAPGSDRFSSVFVSNPPPKVQSFYLMESAIDALSHRQLRSISGDNDFNSVYFSTGGQLTLQQVNTITRYIGSFEKTAKWCIVLCFDGDTKGHKYDLQFIQQLAAVNFPLKTTAGGPDRVAYLLPEAETFRPTREALLNRIELYNNTVLSQFSQTGVGTLGQKELNGQLIAVGRVGKQTQISIPQACAPLSAICGFLLEVSGLAQRIKIEKSCTKDFNMDLTQEVRLGDEFRYAIKDETGLVLFNGNSPADMARTMQQIMQQAEKDVQSKTFILTERQPFGFQKPQVEIKVERGKVIRSIQTPEFGERIRLETK